MPVIDLATTIKFNKLEWIGCGRVYDDKIPVTVKEVMDRAYDIPMAYQDHVLPSPETPIAQFVDLQLPALSSQFIMTKVGAWFSKEPADPEPNISLLYSRPIPKQEFVFKPGDHAGQAWLDGMASLVDPRYDDAVRWPLWVLTFWKRMLYVSRARENWKKSQKWLVHGKRRYQTDPITQRVLDNAICRLSHIGWDTKLASRLWSTKTLTKLLGEEWLDDDHMDMMIDDLSSRITKNPNLQSKVMVTPFCFAYKIATNGTQNVPNRKSLLYRYECLFKENQLEKLYFPIHVNENHWIAGFIDFIEQKVGYGE